MKREIVATKDGSHTLFVPDLNEHYHSINGAINESMHVFIRSGLEYMLNLREEINILEMGFGTGLNALLTEVFSKNHTINYTAVEKYPLKATEIEMLNYHLVDNKLSKPILLSMHQFAWDERFHLLRDRFFLKKINQCFEDIVFEDTYDIIYFDAFSPEIQPRLWEEDVLGKIFDAMRQEGILTTYCAKGIVRRRLETTGFKVERLPGAKGKREMLRAHKK